MTQNLDFPIGEHIASRLRSVRKHSYLSSEDFAGSIDVSPIQYREMERGIKPLTASVLTAIRMRYKVDPEWLILSTVGSNNIGYEPSQSRLRDAEIDEQFFHAMTAEVTKWEDAKKHLLDDDHREAVAVFLYKQVKHWHVPADRILSMLNLVSKKDRTPRAAKLPLTPAQRRCHAISYVLFSLALVALFLSMRQAEAMREGLHLSTLQFMAPSLAASVFFCGGLFVRDFAGWREVDPLYRKLNEQIHSKWLKYRRKMGQKVDQEEDK